MTRWVVVGAGAAGCVVAARLSDDPANQVVLLEAGPDHGTSSDPADVGPLLSDPRRLRVEHVVRRPGAAVEPYWQGFGLGGSSLVNGALVVAGAAPSSHALPTEVPWSDGPVGAALLATDPAATRVGLARVDRHRVTAADAYLRPVAARPNLDIRTDAAVRTVALRGRRATGVELVSGERLSADRTVLCAGAIRTPTILLRSGVDTPGIGDGLQDHPAFTITLALRPDAVDATSPTISVVALHGDHQVVALNHLPDSPALGALTVGLLRVRSTGRLRLPDPDGEPVVELGQLTDPDDADRLCRAVATTLDLLDDPVWHRIVEGAYVDDVGTPAASLTGAPARIASWVPEHLGGHHHVAGTCAEGTVTDHGAVRGYEGLFVCDASAFRGVPDRNPYLEVVTLAERTVRSWS